MPQISRLTLAFDPDGILKEEQLLHLIRGRGFEVLEYEDPIAFRYAYETGFRTRWDKGEVTDLVVVLRTSTNQETEIPFDLLKAGRKIWFRLTDIFPNLSIPVIREINLSDYDKLFGAYNTYSSQRLSENETKDFVLSYLYEIVPHIIKQGSDLLHVLFDLHEKGTRLPPSAQARLFEILHRNDVFQQWPLERLFASKAYFLLFMQERWNFYITSLYQQEKDKVAEANLPYNLKCPGPVDLPFDHPDIKGRISTLFIEGTLQRAEMPQGVDNVSGWVSIGVLAKGSKLVNHTVTSVIDSIRQIVDSPHLNSSDWGRVAFLGATLQKEYCENECQIEDNTKRQFTETIDVIDAKFRSWLLQKYATLHNLPANPPVMVHHIPRFLHYEMSQSPDGGVALVVLDGMSIAQWLKVKEVLLSMIGEVQFEEMSVYAWIPTITSVSRQAIFSGRIPLFFPQSILRTDGEESQWRVFWSDRNVTGSAVQYRHLGDTFSSTEFVSSLTDDGVRTVGIVIDIIDRIMHGMQLGARGMLSQVAQWAKSGMLANLIGSLHSRGFQVYITSDHGNVESTGIGIPKEGSITETKGQRARVYSSRILRDQIHATIKDSWCWEPTGLPDSFWPLLAERRCSFANPGDTVVAHGGASIDEVIVPFVRVVWSNE